MGVTVLVVVAVLLGVLVLCHVTVGELVLLA